MGTKIGVMYAVTAEENSPEAEVVRTWNRLLRKNIDLVKAEGTEVTFQIPRRGLKSLHSFQYIYLNTLNDIETLFGYVELGKSGKYDAIMVMCFNDPMVREARQALNVPFIAPNEAALHMAAMMGKKFGVVSVDTKVNPTLEDLIHERHLDDYSVGVRGLPVSPEEQMKALTDSREDIKGFIKVAKQLVADGAEVIIPGCMILDPVLHFAPGCEKEYPNGINEVDGVPVMNVVAIAIKVAGAFVSLKKAGLPWISRKLYYNSPTKVALADAASMLEYKGPGFWRE